MSECSSCGSPILWVLSARGSRMPLDTTPLPDDHDGKGAFVLVKGKNVGAPVAVAWSKVSELLPVEAVARYASHFSSCPHADEHRRVRA